MTGQEKAEEVHKQMRSGGYCEKGRDRWRSSGGYGWMDRGSNNMTTMITAGRVRAAAAELHEKSGIKPKLDQKPRIA